MSIDLHTVADKARAKRDEAREALRDSGYDALAWMRDNPADGALLIGLSVVVGLLLGLWLG